MNEQIRRQIELMERNAKILREKFNISKDGELLFQAARSKWSEADVVVEADGRGGARLLIVEGNYPADYTTHRQQIFGTEEAACEAAERLCGPALNRTTT